MDSFSENLVLLINQYGPGSLTLDETKQMADLIKNAIANPARFVLVDKQEKKDAPFPMKRQ